MSLSLQDVYGMEAPGGEMEYDTAGGGVTYAVLDEGDVLQVGRLYTRWHTWHQWIIILPNQK